MPIELPMPRQELARIVHMRDLDDGPLELDIDADEDALAALARRFGLEAIEELAAKLTASREGRGIRVEGRFRGKPVQRCVVTRRPVVSTLEEEFAVVFLPEVAEADRAGGTSAVDVDTNEDFEPLTSEAVDVGEVVAQSFSLALEPYPRSSDAGEVGQGSYRDERASQEDERKSPFAVLKNLRDMT